MLRLEDPDDELEEEEDEEEEEGERAIVPLTFPFIRCCFLCSRPLLSFRNSGVVKLRIREIYWPEPG